MKEVNVFRVKILSIKASQKIIAILIKITIIIMELLMMTRIGKAYVSANNNDDYYKDKKLLN